MSPGTGWIVNAAGCQAGRLRDLSESHLACAAYPEHGIKKLDA